MDTLVDLGLRVLSVGEYDAGQRAWEAGEPAEALKQWQSAAQGGDDRAMLALGRLYLSGLGAPQDFVEAHKWFNVAASRGNAEAASKRDALAARMTLQQVATAQERAAAWRPSSARETAGSRTGNEEAGMPPVEALREAQLLLAALGYAPGPADGIWGARSVRAYRSFLRDAGLQEGDVLTLDSLQAMRTVVAHRGQPDPAAAAGRRGTMVTGSPDPAASAQPSDILHAATRAGDLDQLRLAVETGADADARDGRGWTPLMQAANKGYTPFVATLLEAGADPNIRAPDGATALFIAALHGHSQTIELLMKADADPTIRGPKNKTAGDIARLHYGDPETGSTKTASEAVAALLRGMTLDEFREEAEFLRLTASKTITAYRNYLRSHPRGHFTSRAREALEKLERDERQRQAALERERRIVGQPFGPGWYVVKNQPCQVFLPASYLGHPSLLSAAWLGDCVDGKASGQGRLTLEYDSGPLRLETNGGNMQAGKLNGVWRTGMDEGGLADVTFRDSLRHGTYTVYWNNGRRTWAEYNNDKCIRVTNSIRPNKVYNC